MVESGHDIQDRNGSPPRRVALCVWEWSSTTTVLAWAWLRQYFLRQGVDTLYIVHTGKNPNWDKAGPLTPTLEESLSGWSHRVFNFSGSLQSNIIEFLKAYEIDLVLVGEDFPRGGKFLTKNNPLSSSPSEWVKSHISVPFMIIRQDSVLRLRGLRISDCDAPLSPASPKSPAARKEREARRIAIAYSDESVGRQMIQLVRKMVLLPGDEVYMVHCVNAGNQFVQGLKSLKETKSILSRIGSKVGGGSGSGGGSGGAIGKRSSSGELEVSVDDEVAPITGPDITKSVILKGGTSSKAHPGAHKESKDPRHLISDFCEQYSIDLLIISSRSAGRLRKTMTGGSVSSYLINRVACPCLVIPLKTLGYSSEQEMGRSLTSSVSMDMGGLSSTLDEEERLQQLDVEQLKTLVRDLRKELAVRDVLIHELQEEVRAAQRH